MGFHMGWLAVPAAYGDTWLDHAGLSTVDEWSDMAEATLSVRRLPDWYLLVCNDVMHPLLQERALPALSAATPLLYFMAEETSMGFILANWEQGEPRWHITHYGCETPDYLHVEGTPPAAFHDIAGECRQLATLPENRDVDFICEIPVRLGEQLTGYRYDSWPDEDEGQALFQTVLLRNDSPYAIVPPPPRPWYRFW